MNLNQPALARPGHSCLKALYLQHAYMAPWSAANMPDLTGKVAIVTGANTGLGFASALELARKGAHVFITSRDAVRGAR